MSCGFHSQVVPQESTAPTQAARLSPGSCLHLRHSRRRAGNGGSWASTWADVTRKAGWKSWLSRTPSTSARPYAAASPFAAKCQSCPLHHVLVQMRPFWTFNMTGQGGKERQEHPPPVFNLPERKGSAGGSSETRMDPAVNTHTCSGPLQSREGFLYQRSLSWLPQSLLHPTSTPTSLQHHTSSSGTTLISHCLSTLRKHLQSGKRSALDELKDSSCLVQLLTA